jgi:hypothetical protein
MHLLNNCFTYSSGGWQETDTCNGTLAAETLPLTRDSIRVFVTHSSCCQVAIPTEQAPTDMDRIRSFLYRFPRFQADCRMDFIHGDSVVLGTCTSLSQSGLRGTMAEAVPTGSEGLLTLYHANQRFEVRARIDGGDDEETRLSFQFRSDKEKLAIGELLKLLTSRP